MDMKPSGGGVLIEGENCWRIRRADRAAFLIDAESYFSAAAEAIERAERCVYIAGWDVDSRISLVRDTPERSESTRLGRFLDEQAAGNPGLHIHLLVWDFALLYALERESLPRVKLGWRTHRRVHFHMDGNHPPGASHHQKLMVVDDRVAFAGGIDFARRRWDTGEHRAADPRRVDSSGKEYSPFHDVQMMVDAGAAAALGELFRRRWRRATGKQLDAPDGTKADPWPDGCEPDLTDVPVGIVRTQAANEDWEEVREVEALHLDAVAAARELIYIENQYLTSASVCRALADRLERERGPEIVLVLPERSDGWLEEHTMNALRTHYLQRLRRSDRHRRLKVYHPRAPGPGNGLINVHSKVLVVDDELARVGSSNLSNRSMRLDTECDLALEARGRDDVRAAVRRFRCRLLGEHLGLSPDRVDSEHRSRGSLIAAVESLRGGERTLVPLNTGPPDGWVETVVQSDSLVDPERPIDLEEMIEKLEPERERGSWKLKLAGLGALILVLLGLAALWKWTPLGEWIDKETLSAWAGEIRGNPASPFVLAVFYAVATSLMFPVTVLFLATAAVYAPLPAFGLAMLGCLAAALTNYLLGRWLGTRTVRRIAGERLDRLSARLGRQGLVTVSLVRLVPVAPFAVVNLAAGAARVRMAHYLAGTALGMTPGILAITVFTELTIGLISEPGPATVLALLGLAAVVVLAAFWVRRRLAVAGKAGHA
jgi:phosphatidylserine/phosphatidylglycerophosphate/cardiolipin synthase-like enzyme/uncharacterized membrane protein YdjX (TVP38/TMEM64 family)